MLIKEEYIELYVKGGQAINAILEVLNNLAEVKVEIAGEEAIKIIRDFQQKYFDLINEHFKPKELSDSNNELERTVCSLDYALSDVYNHKPYKFEELKPNMWVYDGIEKLICQIGLISKNAIHREYVDGTISDSPFEENRYFPVQCANLIKMEVKEDDI